MAPPPQKRLTTTTTSPIRATGCSTISAHLVLSLLSHGSLSHTRQSIRFSLSPSGQSTARLSSLFLSPPPNSLFLSPPNSLFLSPPPLPFNITTNSLFPNDLHVVVLMIFLPP
ncbi:predicted protein [Arabidopsis lyrata subsp. lyrata]|uniref:Predicted protein n=1 Tax=Arabidopsis lyrata subsp. lyrata TaxID=81972 RepID=D7KJD6_ARALL|nr:predicted protein [Arabidopsis lyrata subsp. lyrata]